MMKDKLNEVILYLCGKKIGTTKLIKLIYLADLEFYNSFGRTITSARYQKYHYGPYSFDIKEQIDALKEKGYITVTEKKTASGNTARLIECNDGAKKFSNLSGDEKMVLNEIHKKWVNQPTEKLVTYAKSTQPYVNSVEHDGTIRFEDIKLKKLLKKQLKANEDLLIHLSQK